MVDEEELTRLVQERNRILREMDIEAAKAFSVRNGGEAPRNVDWERVLHLARFEVTSPDMEQERSASHIWLAMHGAKRLANYSERSPYAMAVCDLLFPRTLTDQYILEKAHG